MPAAKENTKSKSEDPVLQRIAVEAEQLELTQREKLNKANHRDNILWGGLGVLYLVFAVIAIVREDWGNLLFILAVAMPVAVIWTANRVINGQSFVIGMMTGLRDIENKALLDRVQEDMKTAPFKSKSEQRRHEAMKGKK